MDQHNPISGTVGDWRVPQHNGIDEVTMTAGRQYAYTASPVSGNGFCERGQSSHLLNAIWGRGFLVEFRQ